MDGKWDEAEKYILSYVSASALTWKEKTPLVIALCEIRVQKYKECLEK